MSERTQRAALVLFVLCFAVYAANRHLLPLTPLEVPTCAGWPDPRPLGAVAALALTLPAVGGLALWLVPRAALTDGAAVFVFTSALGAGVAGYGLFLAGALSCRVPVLVGVYAALALAGAWVGRERLAPLVRTRWLRVGLPHVALGLLLVPAFFHAMCPPTGFDALNYHLTAPKHFLQVGHLEDVPSSQMTNFPLHVEMLYMLGMAVGTDAAPALLNLYFLGLLALALWVGARQVSRRASGAWLLLAPLAFLCQPFVLVIAGAPNNDFPVSLHVVLGLLCFGRHLEGEPGALAPSSVFLGLAVASKHLGLLCLFAVVVASFASSWRHGRPANERVRECLVLVVVPFLLAAPWYARSALHTGNPVFPVFNRELHALYVGLGVAPGSVAVLEENWFSDVPGLEQVDYRAHGRIFAPADSLADTALFPIKAFLLSQTTFVSGSPTSYGSEVGPLALALAVPLLAVLAPLGRRGHFTLVFSAAYLATVALSTPQSRFLLPLVAVLAPFVPDAAAAFAAPRARAVVVACVLGQAAWSLGNAAVLALNSGTFLAGAGRVTRDDFLAAHLAHYEAYRFLNALPGPVKVMPFFDARTYYLDRHCIWTGLLGLPELGTFLQATSSDDLAERLKRRGATHLYLPPKAFHTLRTLRTDDGYQELVEKFFRERTRALFQQNGAVVLALQ